MDFTIEGQRVDHDRGDCEPMQIHVEVIVGTANLLDALRRFRERTGGYYPGHPRAAPLLSLLMFQLRREVDALEQDVALLEDLLTAGVFLVEQIRRGAEPVYHGGRVTSEDADAPLLTWRPAPDRQRVIFGDLRVETRRHPIESQR